MPHECPSAVCPGPRARGLAGSGWVGNGPGGFRLLALIQALEAAWAPASSADTLGPDLQPSVHPSPGSTHTQHVAPLALSAAGPGMTQARCI